MQLCALDESLPIIASHAKKEKIYLCPECNDPLKVRSGPLRQPHFYHLRSRRACRQSGKSEEHLAVQLKLLDLLGPSCRMECPFPEIQRIADIAWQEKRLILEIQCSPITREEVEQRSADYEKMGYHILWILHDRRFNQKNLSAAEHHLREKGCYFTNINRLMAGQIYDQFEVTRGYKRLFKGPQLPVDPLQFLPTPNLQLDEILLPEILLKRLANWKYSMHGDLLQRLINDRQLSQVASFLREIESRFKERIAPSQELRLPVLKLLAKSYSSLIHYFLKKYS